MLLHEHKVSTAKLLVRNDFRVSKARAKDTYIEDKDINFVLKDND